MKKLLILAGFIFFTSFNAQTGNTGIGTTNPQTKLHIDGASDNVGTPTAAQQANDVVVTSTGKIGAGTLKPFGEIEAVSNTFERGIYSTGFFAGFGGLFGVKSARGDIDNLQSTQNTNGLGWFTGFGHDGTTFALPSNGYSTGMLLRATENYTPTGTGAEIDFYTIPNGSRGGISRMLISQNGNVGINNPTPQAKLDIVAPTPGTGFKLQDGSQGAGKVLTSDAEGNGSWQNVGLNAPSTTGISWSASSTGYLKDPQATTVHYGPYRVDKSGWYNMISRWYYIQNTNTADGGIADAGYGAFAVTIDDTINQTGQEIYNFRGVVNTSPMAISPYGGLIYLKGNQDYYVHSVGYYTTYASTGERQFILYFVQ